MGNPRNGRYVAFAMAAILTARFELPIADAAERANDARRTTETPIEQVIAIIGENRTFDNAYGTYVPNFFGDGPRIPFIVVSPYSRGGKIVHSYADHAWVVKFNERNWRLRPLTGRRRDNLPNPICKRDAYVPDNMPAIGDLFDMFDFPHGTAGSATRKGSRPGL